MTVRSIDTRRDDANKNNQWKINKTRLNKNAGSSEDMSYQSYFTKAMMAYKN